MHSPTDVRSRVSPISSLLMVFVLSAPLTLCMMQRWVHVFVRKVRIATTLATVRSILLLLLHVLMVSTLMMVMVV